MIRRLFHTIVFLCCVLSFNTAQAGPSWQTGVLYDHTSVLGGLLIRFDPAVTPMPDNCAGASWMFIPASAKVMISVTLLAIAMNNRAMTVYTSGITSGFCDVTQVDPVN